MSDIKLACDVVEQVKTICDKHGNNTGELINILHEVRGSIQNVAWTKCRTKYVKPLVHR